MRRSTKKSATATLDTPAAPLSALSAAELEQRTRESLESTRDRLRILGVQLVALGRERDALEAAEAEAGQHAAEAWARAHAAPERLQAVKARLMALTGSAAEGSAQAEVLAAAQSAVLAEEDARQASAAAASVSADAAEKRQELDTAIANAKAEEAELLTLLDALERQAAEAHRTRGFEIVDKAIERAQLLAKVIAAREQVAALTLPMPKGRGFLGRTLRTRHASQWLDAVTGLHVRWRLGYRRRSIGVDFRRPCGMQAV